jgi:hypothetical protein
MNLLGNGLILLALIASVVSTFQYYRATSSNGQSTKQGRLRLKIGAVAIALLSALLLALIL